MKTILSLTTASTLLVLASYVSAEPANPDHASHNHAGSAGPATPGGPRYAAPAGKPCVNAMESRSQTAGMSGRHGKGGTDHQHMMNGEMKGCEHMKPGGAMSKPSANPTPAKP